MTAALCLEEAPRISAIAIARHGEASTADSYILPHHWCFHVYSYQAVLNLDGESYKISPGDASLVPPGVKMTYHYMGPSEHVYFHFQPTLQGKRHELPLVLSLGSSFQSFDGRARKAVLRARSDANYPLVVLWNLLWDYVDLSNAELVDDNNVHDLVGAAVNYIEQNLSLSLSVKTLCDQVGVSYGYLTRLFRRDLGMSVSEYVRQRRAEQASHLLMSTSMPIKAIARSVGVPSLTQFNRLMHGAFGHGPRAIRLGERQKR